MTARIDREHLEADGLWRPEDGAQARDVRVELGEATLMIRDPAGTALAHWSLAAVVDLGGRDTAIVLAPGQGADETLEITDPEMGRAVREIVRTLERAGPRHGRLRRAALAVFAMLVLAWAATAFPEALARHTAAAIDAGGRNEIASRLQAALEPVTGPACNAPLGQDALDRLARITLGEPRWTVRVVPDAPGAVLVLPGRVLLLRRDLVEERDDPRAAVRVLHEAAKQGDPLPALLQAAGPVASLRLLTRAEVPVEALSQQVLRAALPVPSAAPAGEPPWLDEAKWLHLTQICRM